MASVPLKPQYGPTLGQLLAPRWRSSSRLLRGVALAAGGAFAALATAIVLTLLPSAYSHDSPPSFGFTYRGLYRTPAPAGAYVRLERHVGGSLADSLTVWPLTLPAYEGGVSGELPLFAAGYINGLEKRYSDFALLGEGKTHVNTLAGYTIFYAARIAGQRMDGRDVLLVPESSGARRGVAIVIWAEPHADRQVKSALEVGNTGVLKGALHSFEFR